MPGRDPGTFMFIRSGCAFSLIMATTDDHSMSEGMLDFTDFLKSKLVKPQLQKYRLNNKHSCISKVNCCVMYLGEIMRIS